jgi:5-(carboxyamino)imidazole ribonucleotide synthase
MDSTKATYKTLGILGGGQLGRMSAEAAKKLGIRTVIFTPETDSPAAQVADETIVAAYEDHTALQTFAEKVEVISYEFENIPVETIRYLKKLKPVYPDENLLEVAQDRIKEKSFLNSIGIETAEWSAPQNADDLNSLFLMWKTQSIIIKTTRFGYDGKGQWKINSSDNINEFWRSLNGTPVIAESIIDFDYEVSVIVARDAFQKIALYGSIRNVHKNHILDRSFYPVNMPEDLSNKARQMAENLAISINLRGVLALEMFVTKDGKILANEIAPRTHNSGHLTIEAFEASQFEQHVRTVCGLPMGTATPKVASAEMINLIGDDVLHLDQYKNQPDTYIHIYGKSNPRPGRKMGHVTVIKT